MQVSSMRRLFASLDILYNNSLNTKVQKREMNINKEISNKTCQLNDYYDFQDSLQYFF